MRHRLPGGSRRGATLVEAALVLPLFLSMTLGVIDLGIGVFRYHLVCYACRQAARQAIVHGALAGPLGPWGPDPVGPVSGNDPGPLAQAVQPFLVGIDPDTVAIQARWPDGGNGPDQRVTVTVTVPYQPTLTFLFGNPTLTFTATSTMLIAH